MTAQTAYAVSLPVWALFVVGFGAPLLSLLGVVLGQWISRKGSRELEARSRREETMRMLRWAAELALSPDVKTSEFGVSQ